MDIKQFFRENMQVEVYEHQSEMFYKSIIQEVNDDQIAIGIPMKKQDSMMLYEDEVRLFRVPSGDGIYYFESRVLGRKKSNNIPLYLISWPEKVDRKQRREFFRFSCSFDLHYWIIQKSNEQQKDLGFNPRQPAEKIIQYLGKPQKALTTDLSGGGLQMALEKRIPVETLLAIKVFIRSKKVEEDLVVKGKVVRADEQVVSKGKLYRHGIQFVDLNMAMREKIIQLVFTLSREKLQ